MSQSVEICANVANAASILLAGRNSVQTWWTGILGSVLFGWLFFRVQLYADATLQLFFVGTSLLGWWQWQHGRTDVVTPVRSTSRVLLLSLLGGGIAVSTGYGALLYYHTNAYAPFLDSGVLAFSVLGQLLLMFRRVESWWCWLLVNTVAVPLFASRGLVLTSVLYAGFWINALVSLRHWQKLLKA